MLQLLIVITMAVSPAPQRAGEEAGGLVAAAPADGKKLYTRHCKSCHGADGRGNPEIAKTLKIDPKILNLGRAESADLTRDQAKQIVLAGKEKMPSFQKKLKEGEPDPVTDYALALAAEIRKKEGKDEGKDEDEK